jgi:DNA/RNA endonuclease YhcR with UshA esterase domain
MAELRRNQREEDLFEGSLTRLKGHADLFPGSQEVKAANVRDESDVVVISPAEDVIDLFVVHGVD